MATHPESRRRDGQPGDPPPDGNPPPDTRSRQPTSKVPALRPGQRYAAEFLGTALLVLFHAGAAASLRLALNADHTLKSAPDVLYLGVADGFALFLIIMIVGKVSGVLINPAVTLGLASAGRFPRNDVAPYLVAEFAGAIFGAFGVLLIFGDKGASIGHVGAASLGSGVGLIQGLCIEALGAFILVLTISATAEDPRSPSGWAGLAIGLTLGTIVMLMEPATGASVNPARAFGPDLVATFAGLDVNWLDYLVVYLVGPIVGGVLSAHLYRYLAGQPATKPAPPGGGS